MNCVKTSDSVLDINAKDKTPSQDNAEDWFESFKSGTEFAETEAEKAPLQQSIQLVHDICAKDVRDFGIASRTIQETVPCSPDGSSGCRGGSLPGGVPTIDSIRILCADESLSPATGCDRINNSVEFEVVLKYGDSTYAVMTPKEMFSILWSSFRRFPSFQLFPNVGEFKAELKQIDGSCKAIHIDNATVTQSGNDCVLRIDYTVFDKLWKQEDLILLAVKPISDNTTVCDVFSQGHEIGPCTNGSGRTCCGG